MSKILTIGTTIKILANSITIKSYNEADSDTSYDAKKHTIDRMKDYDLLNLNETQIENVLEFGRKFDAWAEWAKSNGYLQGYQQSAISDFFTVMLEGAKHNYELNQNTAEHFFCYVIAKVLYLQLRKYRQHYPNETEQESKGWLLAKFDFFGDDNDYKTDYTPVGSSFALLAKWVKDLNELIKYWEKVIDAKGKREKPADFHNFISKWKKGTTPSWEIIKLFYDNDLCPPEEYFIDDERINKDAYKTFKQNLYMAFVVTHLFDFLEEEEILSEESRSMIRNGIRLYYRDFYITRNMDNEQYSPVFEKEAKDNLMFRTLFVMLDGQLSILPLDQYMSLIAEHPEIPIIYDSIQ